VPLDVRKVSDLPIAAAIIVRGCARFWGRSPQRISVGISSEGRRPSAHQAAEPLAGVERIGKAKPYRTVGGRAARLRIANARARSIAPDARVNTFPYETPRRA
jgi:hypothetical protein